LVRGKKEKKKSKETAGERQKKKPVGKKRDNIIATGKGQFANSQTEGSSRSGGGGSRRKGGVVHGGKTENSDSTNNKSQKMNEATKKSRGSSSAGLGASLLSHNGSIGEDSCGTLETLLHMSDRKTLPRGEGKTTLNVTSEKTELHGALLHEGRGRGDDVQGDCSSGQKETEAISQGQKKQTTKQKRTDLYRKQLSRTDKKGSKGGLSLWDRG